MTDTPIDGPAWLDAARSGGLPVATLARWQPMRVGIVNLWEYDKVDFWFADGRLVLRGGNGAGKTKALELTTLMLMRGEITASALDPFGSQHRSMRFNLLPTGEADDPRALTDVGLGYAWAEFGRLDEHGEQQYFTCGLGASARRGTGTVPVQTWQFVTRQRIDRDVSLTRAGRPLDEAELKKVPEIQVLKNAGQYRARLAQDLFGMEIDAYDNLTELLKQLRKPKLGERLNPSSLAETLRDALPPIGAEEIDHLADGWDRLEQLRAKVDTTKEAAHALASFTRQSWRPWASVVVRLRADELSRTTSSLERTTDLKNRADRDLETTTQQVERVTGELGAMRANKADREVEYRELLKSRAYSDAVAAAGRVETLRSSQSTLSQRRSGAEERRGRSAQAAGQAEATAIAARTEVETVNTRVLSQVSAVTERAGTAGLAAAAARHLPDRDIAGLRVAVDRRFSRFDHHEHLHADYSRAAAKVELSAARVAQYAERHDAAIVEADERRLRLETSVDGLREDLRTWSHGLTIAPATEEQIEFWCDLVADLTDSTSSRTPGDAVRQHLDEQRGRLHRQIAVNEASRRPLLEEQTSLEEEVERLGTIAEGAPPEPLLWSRRERPELTEGRGAPFWRCVNPREGLSSSELDQLEATLAAAGVLDAWIMPSGSLLDADGTESFDLQLRPKEAAGRGLNAVLEPATVEAVPEQAIAAVLAGFEWFPDRASAPDGGSWLAGDGSWSAGSLTGRAAPAHEASYLGAAAREAARTRAIAAAQEQLRRVAADLALLESELAVLTGEGDLLEAEAAGLPSEQPLMEAAGAYSVSLDLVERAERDYEAQRAQHGAVQADADDKRARLAEHASEFEFPLDGLPAYARVLNSCRQAVVELSSLIELLESRREALEAAESVATARRDDLVDLTEELERLTIELRQVRIQLETAETSLAADHHDLLDQADRLAGLLSQYDQSITASSEELSDARVAAANAELVLAQHEDRRREAEEARGEALSAWWAAADAGLLEPLGLTVPERRVVETGRESARAARRALRGVADPAVEDRAWRKCLTDLQELRQQMLPARDLRIDDEGPVPLVQVLAEASAGWQPPQQASDSLAAAVQDLEDRYDAAQRDVLSTLLESNFIEHLKDRLDYTETTFLDINRQLADHPTRQGHIVRLERMPDPADPEAVTVVKDLGHGYAQLGTDRQDRVRDFLSRKIDAARADATAEGASDWKEELSKALDYRRWLRIELQFKPGAGASWRRFDNASHGSKSGGEKVVLLSQPLFAAAVVAYNAAGQGAPRWIWLDEAMTGVDVSVKESFMGLTVEFDLDIMLTAHDEWCTYRTVPAVAVYDLARDRDLPGVDAESYLWLGGELTQIEAPLSIEAVGNG
jgi:uncharacterized protein (TIGR02680 family)